MGGCPSLRGVQTVLFEADWTQCPPPNLLRFTIPSGSGAERYFRGTGGSQSGSTRGTWSKGTSNVVLQPSSYGRSSHRQTTSSIGGTWAEIRRPTHNRGSVQPLATFLRALLPSRLAEQSPTSALEPNDGEPAVRVGRTRCPFHCVCLRRKFYTLEQPQREGNGPIVWEHGPKVIIEEEGGPRPTPEQHLYSARVPHPKLKCLAGIRALCRNPGRSRGPPVARRLLISLMRLKWGVTATIASRPKLSNSEQTRTVNFVTLPTR